MMARENDKQQAIEDDFFGKKDVLKIPEIDDTPTPGLHNMRSDTAREATEAIDTNTPESLIDRLQSQGKLPESLHSSQLSNFLRFLGKKLDISIRVEGEEALFPQNSRTLDLKVENLALFLRRGALASTFLLPLVMSSQALAQELQPGMDLIDSGVTAVVNEGHYMFHWDNVVALLVLLGVTGFVAKALIKKFKKTNQEKLAYSGFKDYQKAVKKGDRVAADKAKKDILAGSMSELPADIDSVADKVTITDQDEIKKAFEIKSLVDTATNAATLEIEEAMLLPDEKSLEIIENIKNKVLALFDKQIEILEELYKKLAEEWAKAPDGSYLKQQLEYEKKKLRYSINYLKGMKKKWLVVIQSAKNDLVGVAVGKGLSVEDQAQKDALDLTNQLSDTMDQQSTLDPVAFKTAVDDLDVKITEKIEEARKGEDESKEIGWDKIVLKNDGHYDHKSGINYSISGHEFHVDLDKNFDVQIWINDEKKIQMNFNHRGVLIDFQPLLVLSDKGFVVKDTGQTLEDYIKEKQADDDIKATEAAVDLSPEAEPILDALAKAVIEVTGEIKGNSYSTFGRKVEADDEAIKYHLMRVHREFYKGKPQTVVRFTLEESYWQKALADLDKQHDIPKNTVNFDYENEQGGKMSISQPMRRFNVVVGSRQATVLITASEQYKALAGEVRVILDPKDDFTADELKQVFNEVSKRLVLNDHIKPVTPDAKKRLRKKLKAIRKDGADPAGTTVDIHSEYSAETVSAHAVEDLKKQGLHSMYHQFDIDVLGPMFKSGKLMCTTTRWSKGVLKSGMSSTTDLGNGGATEVFMRCHTNSSAKQGVWANDKPAVVFAPKLLGRLDCYCYASDKYGSKMPGVFDQRIGPSKLIDQLSGAYTSGHEVMMHDAVDLADAQYIVYSNPAEIIQKLKHDGVTNIGGKPLEKAVITRSQFEKISTL